MPVVHRDRWTSADVDRLIDERDGLSPRYELLGGELLGGELLVTPAPSGRHQRIIIQLALLPQPYSRVTNWARSDPGDWRPTGDTLAFEIWHPADRRGALVDDRVTWTPDGAPEPFELDVHAFFASVEDQGPLP